MTGTDRPVEATAAAVAKTLEPYPEMKDSGVAWLGEVPAHWEIKKLRHLLRSVVTRNQPDLPLLSVVREQGVILRDLSNRDENHNYVPDDLSNYKVVQQGQFAMNKMKAWQGSYGVSKFNGLVSPAYFVFALHGVDGDFFHTAIRSKAYVPSFNKASDGVRIGQWDLSKARMREISVAVPTAPDEQTAIVRYLDYIDRRVRWLTKAKRKLVALLKEQKQALVHRAVTRGLDPDAPMKDSGVEWLGEVPAHWEVLPICAVSNLKSVRNCPERELLSVYLDKSVVRFSDVEEKRANATSVDLINYQAVDPGDFVLNNQQAWRGSVGVSQYKGIVSPAYIVLSLNDCWNPVYANYLLRTKLMVSQYLIFSKGVGTIQRNLYWPELKKVSVILPPLPEQTAIVAYLDKAAADIDAAIARADREVELLDEYRARLVADVVTGKLDVREAAAALPQVDPLAAEDETDDPGLDETPTEADNIDASRETAAV